MVLQPLKRGSSLSARVQTDASPITLIFLLSERPFSVNALTLRATYAASAATILATATKTTFVLNKMFFILFYSINPPYGCPAPTRTTIHTHIQGIMRPMPKHHLEDTPLLTFLGLIILISVVLKSKMRGY